MKVLFDQGVPVPLRTRLVGHDIITVFERGWSVLSNGELMAAAETHGFDVFVTTDQNLKYQQNLAERRMSIIVLQSTSWPRIQKQVDAIVAAIARAKSGSFDEIPIP